MKVNKSTENKTAQTHRQAPAQEAIGKNLHQFKDERPETAQLQQLQQIANEHSAAQPTIQQKKNNTGLPDNLKSGIENLSGFSMDDVKVHRNSDKPAQLNAHAYAQGTDIHLAPGQEKHLPHEAWHVVQQKQGRVQPTKQLKGKVNINDDSGLEKEADVMGAKALKAYNIQRKKNTSFDKNLTNITVIPTTVQRWPQIQTGSGNFEYTLGHNFQERHVAGSKAAAMELARELYDPHHREGSHSAYVTVIYGDFSEIADGTDARVPSGYHWALTIDINAVCMGPSGRRNDNGDPGFMDENITSVTVAGYGEGTTENQAKITHVSTSI